MHGRMVFQPIVNISDTASVKVAKTRQQEKHPFALTDLPLTKVFFLVGFLFTNSSFIRIKSRGLKIIFLGLTSSGFLVYIDLETYCCCHYDSIYPFIQTLTLWLLVLLCFLISCKMSVDRSLNSFVKLILPSFDCLLIHNSFV